MFSYGADNEIDFDENPIVQLIGKNGNGKTSIGLVLEELLFNKNSKGIKKAAVLNRYSGSKSYSGEVEFFINEDHYKVSTKRGSTQAVKLEKNGVDVSAHTATNTYKLIEELLGFDHKTFTQIISQSSASSLEFLTATDTQRKKFLIDLLNLSEYIKTGEYFKLLLKDLENEIVVVKGKLSVVESWISKNSLSNYDLKALLPIPLVDSTLRSRIAAIDHSLLNLAGTNKQIAQNNKYKELLDSIILPPVSNKPEDTRSALQAEIARYNSEVTQSDKLLTKFGKLQGCCPTCDQEVNVAKISQILEEASKAKQVANSNVASLRLKLAEKEKELLTWESDKQIHEKFENYHSLYNPTLQTDLLDETQLRLEKKELQTTLLQQESELSRVEKYNADATAYNTRIELIKSQIDDYKASKAELEGSLDTLVSKKNKVEVLVKTFSTSGLVAYKIECLIKDLEDITNKYLAELSGGRFQLTFQISGSDKLNVVITDNGMDVEIVELSNGERARVNMAALLGIRKLLQGTSNNEINLLFLDEVIENLDVDGKEKLIEVLLNEPTLNTVLVSHGFSHPLLEKIHVVKEHGISRIE